MDFTAPSFSLGIDFDDPPPAAARSDRRDQARVYAAPDAPSFSLGIEFEGFSGGTDEPHLPAGSHREERARRYEAPDAPSFSLGFDDDDDGDGASAPRLSAGSRREERAPRYEAPDAPSFSLGIDDDDSDGDGDGASEPRLPAGRRQEEQSRCHEAPDAPSLPLGIDDDDDFVPGGRRHELARPQVAPGPPSWLAIDDEDDDFFLAGGQRPDRARGATSDPASLPLQHDTTRFKRLRRGPAPPPLAPIPPPPRTPAPMVTEASPVSSGKAALGAIGSLEDEIEDFTDEERPTRGMPPSVGSCSTSTNAKFSLLNRNVLTSQSKSKAKIPKFTEMSNSSASKPLELSCTKKLLPKITISPMRKIHLLDSDTESDDNKNQNKAKKPVSPIKGRQESVRKYVQKKPSVQQSSKSEGSTIVQKNKDMTNNSWATPALDEFCSEYFKSVKDSRQSSQQKDVSSLSGSKVSRSYNSVGEIGKHFQHQSTSSGVVLEENLTDSRPPAMHYFFHHDLMVQKLVRERLQHFVPTGAETTQRNEYSGGENLNYRSQFGQSGDANGQWVAPNRRTSVPTDAGKRRVHASGTQSGSGHWFTGEDGRKVYVSKNGQELTGRDAYRQYKKESGRGFRKFKKKGTVKKEGSAGAKRGSSRANKATSTVKRSSAAKRKR